MLLMICTAKPVAQAQQLFTPVADIEKAEKRVASAPALVMKSQEAKATSQGAEAASPHWHVEVLEDQTLSTVDLSPS
eukprot:s69_g20.t2